MVLPDNWFAEVHVLFSLVKHGLRFGLIAEEILHKLADPPDCRITVKADNPLRQIPRDSQWQEWRSR